MLDGQTFAKLRNGGSRGLQAPEAGQSSKPALQAAEKVLRLAKTPERHPAGAKARVQSTALTARLKSCPDACGAPTIVFPQPVKPDADSIGFMPGINPRPTARQEFFRSLFDPSQPMTPDGRKRDGPAGKRCRGRSGWRCKAFGGRIGGRKKLHRNLATFLEVPHQTNN